MQTRTAQVATLVLGIVIGLAIYGVLHRLFWILVGVAIAVVGYYYLKLRRN